MAKSAIRIKIFDFFARIYVLFTLPFTYRLHTSYTPSTKAVNSQMRKKEASY